MGIYGRALMGCKISLEKEPVVNRFVLNLANVTQLCMENLQERSGGQEPDPQTGFSCGNQA